MKDDGKIWYPFTNIKESEYPIKIVRGEGAYLYDSDGKKYFDAVSSWWTNTYGHLNEHIVSAIKNQLEQLEHIMFAGLTHEPAEEVADLLLKKLGLHFSKVFFSDNGSTAIEVALKMCLQHYFNKGQERSIILSFNGAYHGDTFGAMAAGERGGFNVAFEKLFFDVVQLPYPATWYSESEEVVFEKEKKALDELNKLIELHKNKIACLIIEPLVQGAGGMNMCRAQFLQQLDSICKEHHIFVIYDEVMTGFGRTGADFAFQKANTKPDLICLSKGLTAGFLPMAVTVTTQEVFEPFYSSNIHHSFFHGHSYTANPLACSAAIASIKLLDDYKQERIKMENYFSEKTKELSVLQYFNNVRFCGCILAFELKTRTKTSYFNPVSSQIRGYLLDKGYILRPLGNTIYFIAPYVSDTSEFDSIVKLILAFNEL